MNLRVIIWKHFDVVIVLPDNGSPCGKTNCSVFYCSVSVRARSYLNLTNEMQLQNDVMFR